MKFYKLQALGNDFVFVDKKEKISVKNICDRNFGIGADGVIFYSNSEGKIIVSLYNADGSRAKSLGNGMFCAADLFCFLNNKKSGEVIFSDKSYFFEKCKNNFIHMNFDRAQSIKLENDFFKVKAGNLHKIYFTDSFIEDEIVQKAECDKKYNIEFVSKKNEGYVVKVFESGAGFTKGCASGAAAIFSVLNKADGLESMNFYFDGGKITARMLKGEIILTGKAKLIYEGVFFS
ncbi:MAG: hypothetical protein ACQESP_11275 [Candidatus Muiribacteriota bacterium]